MENTKIVTVKCEHFDRKNKRYIVTCEDGRKGYIAIDDMTIYPFKSIMQAKTFVDKELRAVIVSEDENTITLTRIPIMKARIEELINGNHKEKVLNVKVISSSDIALYVDLGDYVSGIIYKNDLISANFAYPEDIYPVGSVIPVKIKSYRDEKSFFTVSHREVFSKDKSQYYTGMHIEGIVRAPIFCKGAITGYFVQITPAIAGIVDVNDIRLENGDIIPMIVKDIKPRGLKLRLEFPN